MLKKFHIFMKPLTAESFLFYFQMHSGFVQRNFLFTNGPNWSGNYKDNDARNVEGNKKLSLICLLFPAHKSDVWGSISDSLFSSTK